LDPLKLRATVEEVTVKVFDEVADEVDGKSGR
jgi:hypothetical protein